MEVTVYTKTGCMQCQATKTLMDRLGIEYNLIDISNNTGITAFLQREGHKSLPVVFVDHDEDTDSWCGFRPNLIKQLRPFVRCA